MFAPLSLYGRGLDGSAKINSISGTASLTFSYNGYLGLTDKNDNVKLSFSPAGVMEVGEVPVLRLSGLSHEIGSSKTAVMSQYGIREYTAPKSVYSLSSDGSARIKSPAGNIDLELSYNGWLNIINKAGIATLSFAPSGTMQAGTVPVERLSGYIRGVGDGQSWRTVARQLGSAYTNTTGRPIMLAITLDTGGDNNKFYRTVLRVTNDSGSVIVGFLGTYKPTADPGYDAVTTIIPAGASYSLNDYGSTSFINNSMLAWAELTQ